MNSVALRDYQQEALAAVQKELEQGVTKQLIVLPTGSGKTLVAAGLAKLYSKKLLFIAHRDELINQAVDKFTLHWPTADIGICKALKNEIDHQIVIGSVQTCSQAKRLAQLKKQNFQILVIDEAHHSTAPSYRRIIDELGFNDKTKLVVGLTATPMRTKETEGLGDVFEKIIYSRSISTMIKAGYLVPVVGRRIATKIDLKGIRIEKGDFEVAGLSRAVNKPERNELIVQKYLLHAQNRKGIAFCADVKHAHDLTRTFQEHNISCATVWGAMDSESRRSTLDDFKRGQLQMLTTVGVLTEGFDETSLSTILMCKPTRSLTLFTQCIGRGLRPHPLKENCLVIDFADNYHSIDSIITLTKSVPEAIEIDDEQEKDVTAIQDDQTTVSGSVVEIYDEEFDLLGQRQFVWIALGDDEYSLADDQRNEIIIRPVEGGYIAELYHGNAYAEQVQGRPLPLEYCQGVAEDWARKHLNLYYVDTKGQWIKDSRQAPATQGQTSFLSKNGVDATRMSKMRASVEVRKIIAMQNKERRREMLTGNITPAQKIMLHRAGIDSTHMSRSAANQTIALLKEVYGVIGWQEQKL